MYTKDTVEVDGTQNRKGYLCSCNCCGGFLDDDGMTVGNALFAEKPYDLMTIALDNDWTMIGDLAICPDCMEKIRNGEVSVKFERPLKDGNGVASGRTIPEMLDEMDVFIRKWKREYLVRHPADHEMPSEVGDTARVVS